MENLNGPGSSAGTGLNDDVATYAANAPPLTENAAFEKHSPVLHALVAIMSIGGLGAPMLFRDIDDAGLYLVAVASPFVVALLLAGRRVASPKNVAPESCAFRAVIITVGFVAITSGLYVALVMDTLVRSFVVAACMMGTAFLFMRGLRHGRLTFYVLGLAAFTLTFPLLRIARAYGG